MMTFKEYLAEGLKSENDKINNEYPKNIRVFDSRSSKTLYKFKLMDDGKYKATSKVQDIDNDEVKQLKNIDGKVYTFDALKTFLDKTKDKFAFVNVSQKL